jgi:hypothetical protein
MTGSNQQITNTKVTPLFAGTASGTTTLKASNIEVQLPKLLAAKDPDIVASALVELVATIDDSNFPQAVLNRSMKQCLEAHADPELARVRTQSKIDADFYDVDNVARLSSLVRSIRTWMAAHNVPAGTLEQRIA